MAWITPKTNWVTVPKSPMAEDFNRIEGNIDFLLNEIEVKKGSLVNAINEKQNLVTLESSYADMANAIGVLNDNPRVASGTGTLTQVSANQAKLTVTGLSFQPAKVFIRGTVRTRIADSNDPYNYPYSFENRINYDYGVVNGVIHPVSKLGMYYSIANIGGSPFPIYSSSEARVSVSVTYQSNGFTATFTQTHPSGKLEMDNYGTQHWFAYEQEG